MVQPFSRRAAGTVHTGRFFVFRASPEALPFVPVVPLVPVVPEDAEVPEAAEEDEEDEEDPVGSAVDGLQESFPALKDGTLSVSDPERPTGPVASLRSSMTSSVKTSTGASDPPKREESLDAGARFVTLTLLAIRPGFSLEGGACPSAASVVTSIQSGSQGLEAWPSPASPAPTTGIGTPSGSSSDSPVTI
jgi:hypothetical protein